jgi:hypothetical protein
VAKIRTDSEGRKWLNDVTLTDLEASMGHERAKDAWGAYEEYKAQNALAKEAREQFERLARTGISGGDKLVFGYRFSKLSLGIGEAKLERVAAQSASLADFLDGQDTGGYRA